MSSKVKLNVDDAIQNSQLVSIFVAALTPKLHFEMSKNIDSYDSLQACERMAKRLEHLLSSQITKNYILLNEKNEEIYLTDSSSKFDKYKKTQKRFTKYPNKYSHAIDNTALSQKILRITNREILMKSTTTKQVEKPK